MKPILTSILFLLFTTTIHAQKPSKLDSLKNVLAHLPAEGKSFAGDTLRVRVLCEMGEVGFFIMGDSTLILLNKALKLSQNRNWEKGIALTYYFTGEHFMVKNENMRAVDYFYKSLTISTEKKDKYLVANTYKTLGDCYSELGNYEKAIQYNKKSINLFKALNDQRLYIKGFNNIGLIYQDMKNYDKAIDFYKKGLALNQKYKFKKLDSFFLTNMGLAFVKRGSYDEAIQCYDKVLEGHKNISEYGDIYIFISMAEIYEKKKQPKLALAYLGKAKKIMQQGKGIDSVQLMFSEISFRVYNQLNQYDEALKQHLIFTEIKERNTKQDAEKRIKNLQLEFDNQNQQKEIQILKRNGFIVFGIASILVIFGLILFRINKKLTSKNITIEIQKEEISRANQQLEHFNNELEEKVELRTSELKRANADLLKKNDEILAALVEGQTIERKRVSAELHDNLGSTISGIKYRLQTLDLAKYTEKEKYIYTSVMAMMNDAYSEVRLISHNLLPIEFEKKGLQGALEKLVNDINLSGKFELSLIYKQPKNLIEHNVAIELYSICLELVNNMIKHSNGSKGEIYLFSSKSHTILNVNDNGNNAKGFSEGFGIKNIKIRISKLNGEVEIQNNNLELDITIRIPIKVHHQIDLDYK